MTQSDKEPLVCIVDRKTWMRGGKGKYGQQLLLVNHDGTKCCLGFLGEICGIPSERLHYPMPDAIQAGDWKKYPTLISASGWYSFSIVNDNLTITEQEREETLQELAKEAGFSFKFEG